MPSRYIFIGGMREDYCITHAGQVFSRILGGNAVYAAVGARHWSDSVGVISRVGANYPGEWLEMMNANGIDVSGVVILPEEQDTRTFYAYVSPEERIDTNPEQHYQKIGAKIPKELSGYHSSTGGQDQRSQYGPLTVRPDDIPKSLRHTKAVHLAPTDFLTHFTLPRILRDRGIRCITVDPSIRYMDPAFGTEVHAILDGIDAFLPSEMEIRSFFAHDQLEPWHMAEALSQDGCPLIILKMGAGGQLVWDASNQRRYHIPAYPARVQDVTGAGDAFCGGFVVGLYETEDPIEATLMGNISASLTIEGHGALYALGSTPGLAEARLSSLRREVRQL